MDYALFQTILENILGIACEDVTDMSSSLEIFEKKNCFSSHLQPMFTKDALHYLLNASNPDTIYEIIDSIGVCACFFEFTNHRFILGPYVKDEYSDIKTETILAQYNEPSSKSIPLKLYYTGFPICYTDQLTKIINNCIVSFAPEITEYSYRRLSGFIQDETETFDAQEYKEKNYSEIYKRYDSEKRFLSMIKNGDTENLLSAFSAMKSGNPLTAFPKETMSYYASGSGIAILRALSRKAAEESGLSVITIDTITQKYIQLSTKAANRDLQTKYLTDMIKELTEAVHDYRLSTGGHSPAIQKALEYISLNLSEKISSEDIAREANISVSYLLKIFKEEIGDTVTGYIAKKRCQKAAELLRESSLPIQEISSFVGYPDNNYFVKVFKRIYSVSPSVYRSRKD
ncbi:helix-turn-helix domain-containing protein [Butyrivibrio sp. AE3004]|uniref:helix-turn-helix domain-containing protein n=1 Tax=Butyrivibrio sp. AE3004 TaxID=1506994 RepID=UPI000493C42E|nr:AraC family transcriptional regulator [Butyrivibrio sp. AE3004]